MVVTRGVGKRPDLDLLEEVRWTLSVELDEECALDGTRLVATGFGGWVTIFQPPLPFDDEFEEISGCQSVLRDRNPQVVRQAA
jgi:hypothetical protein